MSTTSCRLFSLILTLFVSLCQSVHAAGFSSKIYGVNLGSWLVLEPWMLPGEWISMGGQNCADCSTCIRSEFAFVQAYPNTADATFNKHWNTWFSQSDVDALASVGINTVRIPLGYWIVEALVDRRTEFYPRGGLAQLRRGLQQLGKAGIVAILDHHALPGVQTPGQMFTGRCTTDVQFYTDANYHRALVWTAVMTALTHLDPAFSNVVSIEAVNEPIMNALLTPGYGNFQKNFVEVMRTVEFMLGIPVPGYKPFQASFDTNVTFTMAQASSAITNPEVQKAVTQAIPILLEIALQLKIDTISEWATFSVGSATRGPLTSSFMDINWQYNNPANPADAAIGPQIYDNHLYYSFGGVANATEYAYMQSICNLNRIAKDAALGNSPLVFGEWGLPTQFNATDTFLNKWADAQKLAYSQGAGWIFWNFKTEISAAAGDLARQWSYLEGVNRGYLTKDPSQLHDPHVCDMYRTTL
ncbi:glycoside hydrolase family 5 protein [Tricholoma matsutake]|nr:glycoside hydrolase family 5 protein [Tricholoma matsutake 945]